MKTLIITLVLGLALALQGPAGAEEANLEGIAEGIRDGSIEVQGDVSMDYRKGRYHAIHVDLLGLDCGSCHYGDAYVADYLLLRRHEVLRKRAEGQADRTGCVACHQRGGIATTFYEGRPGTLPARADGP